MEERNEEVLESRALEVRDQVFEMKVVDNQSYEYAGNYLMKIKETCKGIEEYWKEPKANAHSTWKAICNKENEMKKPLEEAEKYLKKQISDYVRIQEDERKQAEEEARKESGLQIKLESDLPQLQGTSFITDYEVIVEDITKVPTMFDGIQIVQIDYATIKKLAKIYKGKLNIPGIKIEETKRVSVRTK